MKKVILSLFVAMLATVTVQAQQIAVVTGSTTKMCQTLKDAIEASSKGSVIYLPGGGFQIDNATKITKQVTIIGIGHKANSENADGNTVISGNLSFNEGSSGSAVMGCYISGDVVIGEGDASVNNVLVKYCNLNSIQVKNNTCTGTVINQNYIRRSSDFGNSSASLSNNVLYTFQGITGGEVLNNIVTNTYYLNVISASNSTISYNVFFNCMGGASNKGFCAGDNNIGTNNIYPSSHNEYAEFDNKIILDVTWDDVFVKNAGVSPASDFHFKDDFKQYSDIGIYGGTGFSDSGMAPVPFIEAKSIPDKTDAAGMLKIKIRVKASE